MKLKKSESFVDKNNHTITIDAGPNGWTIMWADKSTTYKDVKKSTTENFEDAVKTAKNIVGDLTPLTKSHVSSACEAMYMDN